MRHPRDLTHVSDNRVALLDFYFVQLRANDPFRSGALYHVRDIFQIHLEPIVLVEDRIAIRRVSMFLVHWCGGSTNEDSHDISLAYGK